MYEWLAFGSPRHMLERRQFVPAPLARVAAFFEDPANLERLTPRALSFEILSLRPPHMGAGTVIDYRLRLLGIPFRWRSLIRDFEPGRRFVDVQLRGPYALWEHEHRFEQVEGGTLVHDRVVYRMPFGPLGVLVHAFFVRPQLRSIFDYRQKVMAQLFQEA